MVVKILKFIKYFKMNNTKKTYFPKSIATICSPIPLVELLGRNFGSQANSLTCIYLIGSCFWNFFIALYRVDLILWKGRLFKNVGEIRKDKFII